MEFEIVLKFFPIRIAREPIILAGGRSEVAAAIVPRLAIGKPIPGRAIARLALATERQLESGAIESWRIDSVHELE